MKKNMYLKFENLRNKMDKTVIASTSALSITNLCSNVFASADVGKAKVISALGQIGPYIGLGGGIFLVFGIVSYAMASSDDNGPGMNKAKKEMMSGAMVTGIGLALAAIASAIL